MKTPLLAALAVVALAAPAAAGPATERRLHTDLVDSSSFLWNDWNKFQENYHPNYVADDDPKTAWTEGAESSGAGEWLRIKVTELAGTSKVRLKIRNGYQKSAKLFAANARGKDVTLKLLPGGATRKVTLADAQGWQWVELEQPAGPLEAIELDFGSVYEGKKYTDLVISDVQVFATSTSRENPAFEKSKRKKLLAWKSERIKAAKLFKNAAAKDIPLHPAYKIASTEVDSVELYEKCDNDKRCYVRKAIELAAKDPAFKKTWGKLLPAAMQAVSADLKGFAPAQIAATDKRPIPVVDGLSVPEVYFEFEGAYGYQGFSLPLVGTLASLRGESLRPLEIKSDVTLDEVLNETAPGCNTEAGKTYAWLMRTKLAGEKEGRDILRAMLLVRCATVEVREGTSTIAQLQVLVYGDDGNLALTAGSGYVNGFTWANQDGRLVLSGGRAIWAYGTRDDLTPASAPAPAPAPTPAPAPAK